MYYNTLSAYPFPYAKRQNAYHSFHSSELANANLVIFYTFSQTMSITNCLNIENSWILTKYSTSPKYVLYAFIITFSQTPQEHTCQPTGSLVVQAISTQELIVILSEWLILFELMLKCKQYTYHIKTLSLHGHCYPNPKGNNAQKCFIKLCIQPKINLCIDEISAMCYN